MSSRGKTIAPPTNHRQILFALSCTASLLTIGLTVPLSKLPLFDASPHVLLPPPAIVTSFRHSLASAVLRWDAFHFAHIAKDGYVYEYEWAFFPGTPFLLRTIGRLFHTFMPSEAPLLGWDAVLLGGLLSSTFSVLSVLVLYDLTLLHLASPDAALLASLLSLLPSSPVTLRLAGYTEPLFTLLSYQGMLYCARSQWLFAACAFALAGTFRSNGIFLCGFIIWGLVVEPLLTRRVVRLSRVLHAAALSALTFLPFVYHQYTAYNLFCVQSPERPPWCGSFPPLVYPYVQSKYWNVGFLRYWTVQQLPNFLIAAPPLLLILTFIAHYIHTSLLPRLHLFLSYPSAQSSSLKSTPKPRTHSTFLRPSLASHVLHALAISLLLLFASHTQIVLRLAAAMPLTYWAAAWLLVKHPALGRLWIGWSVVWGGISCITWAAFLPPA